MDSSKCCICGLVKNCAPYLEQVFTNIQIIASQFNEYKIIFAYDESSDNSLSILRNFADNNPNIIIHIETEKPSFYRVYNIARARNHCLQIIRKYFSHYDYFIMIDCDDVCSGQMDISILNYYMTHNIEWDALSFARMPYYDTWALSKYPYVFSNMHFANYNNVVNFIENIIKNTLNGTLIPCLSAFNGFAIYRTNKFIKYFYDYRPRLDLLPIHLIKNQLRICGPMYFKGKAKMIDCEHRSFHLMAVNDGARIRIAPEILFTNTKISKDDSKHSKESSC